MTAFHLTDTAGRPMTWAELEAKRAAYYATHDRYGDLLLPLTSALPGRYRPDAGCYLCRRTYHDQCNGRMATAGRRGANTVPCVCAAGGHRGEGEQS